MNEDYTLGVLNLYLRNELGPDEKQAFESKVAKFSDITTYRAMIASLTDYRFAIVYDDKTNEPITIFDLQKVSDDEATTRYDHLEDKIGLAIPDVAAQLMDINYGQQRMLSAIVRLRETRPEYFKFPEYKKRTEQLRDLLGNGWY